MRNVNAPSDSTQPQLQDKFNRDIEVSVNLLVDKVKTLDSDVAQMKPDIAQLRIDFDALEVEWREFYDVEWNTFYNTDWPAEQATILSNTDRITALENA